MQNHTVVFTISSLNYFAQAKTLLDSVHEQHKDVDLCYLLADEYSTDFSIQNQCFSTFLAKDINIPNFHQLAFKYEVIEFNTAIKPFFINYLFALGYEKVIYLDPDIYVFNKLDYIFELLENNSIVLTPHITQPELLFEEIHSYEFGFLTAGIYNLGFIGLANNTDTHQLIKWWCKRCEDECYAFNHNSTYVDQKWMDFVPALFNNVYITKNLGCNMAVWNIMERTLNSSLVVNNQYPLLFYHFSSFDIECKLVSKNSDIALSKRSDLQSIYEIYRITLLKNDYHLFKNYQYHYNHYANGNMITHLARRFFLIVQDEYPNPFEINTNNFFTLAKKKGLVCQKRTKKMPLAIEIQKRNNIYMNLNRFARMWHFLLGTEKFHQVSHFFKNYFSYLIKGQFLSKR